MVSFFWQLMSMTSNKISKERNYALSGALFAFCILKFSLLKEVARYVIFVMFANMKSQHRCWWQNVEAIFSRPYFFRKSIFYNKNLDKITRNSVSHEQHSSETLNSQIELIKRNTNQRKSNRGHQETIVEGASTGQIFDQPVDKNQSPFKEDPRFG